MEVDNEIHYIHKVLSYMICATSKQSVATGPNPQDLPLEPLQNGTEYESI